MNSRQTAERQDLLAAVDAEYQDRTHAIDAESADADQKIAKASDPADRQQWQAKKDRLAADRQAVTADYGAFRGAVEAVADRSQRFYLAERRLATGDAYPVAFLGQKLLGDYLLPFEIASVLLLVVMIGAAYLAKGRRREAEALAGRAMGEAELSRQARQWT